MPAPDRKALMPNALQTKLTHLVDRVRHVDLDSVVDRAKMVGRRHGRDWRPIFADMVWEAGRHGTNFQDYCDWDFALLTRGERRTYMTNTISSFLIEQLNDPEANEIFEDKIRFNELFAEHLGREWIDLERTDAEGLRAFVERHGGRAITKIPVSYSGYGIGMLKAAEVDDWAAEHARLREKGMRLVEEVLVQHPGLAAIAPGTVNTTRVTTFWDGQRMHVLGFAQKFGVVEGASDQQIYGGVYTQLDLEGRSLGPGYGYHGKIYATHPVTGGSIVDFQLPMATEVLELCERLCAVVPQVPYVGWDIAVTPAGPVVIEGNRSPGVYENKFSATGRRTGQLAHFEREIGFAWSGRGQRSLGASTR